MITVFQVCDSILNVGPCGHVAMGQPSFLSEELQATTKADPDVELVSTSGHGKNGALCVLQQTIRPQVVTTFELPGVVDMWTVIGTIHILRKHLYSTKLNLTFKFFTKTVLDFLSQQKNFFFNITF
jgi:hypothetical protein